MSFPSLVAFAVCLVTLFQNAFINASAVDSEDSLSPPRRTVGVDAIVHGRSNEREALGVLGHRDHHHRSNHLPASPQNGAHRQDQAVPLPCGTQPPTLEEVRSAQETEREFSAKSFGFLSWLWSFLWPFKTPRTSVPTYYHIISPSMDNPSPTDEAIHEQHTILNKAFKDPGFVFELKEITRTVNDAWYSFQEPNSRDEIEMRVSLRRGGAESLNVYIKSSPFCGYAMYPMFYLIFDAIDGVVLNENCMPGGIHQDRQGETLVHEVRQWLG